MLKPTLFLVLTLGLIGTWQVFDQIYVMSQGNPAKTTLTPAYLSYRTAFRDFDYGLGRGDLVRPVRDHHRADAAPAVGAARQGRRASADRGASGRTGATAGGGADDDGAA